ncbi:restriction endonuclease subunit S [Campylobacter ureolyticus]|uniref:restriction endonuclease subunit S n=1 Tax=Campylobacter ureolyticus TaxID=827 RepID=UPI0022B38040|nr:restriction endonuclease subunit S [Campylobacter ureolyticus]MCZ6169166.1 restriction endonuclease subunit S [Campylobacter ureolyticus]
MFKQERGKEAAPNRVPEGKYNMINEISTNNGVSKQGHSENIIKGNSITVSVNYAENVFYQKYDYCASVNILVLRAKWLTENIGLFISKIISKYNKKYDYAQKISKDRLNNAIIKLPIKDENLGDDLENIDFKFMEDFIAELEAQRIAELEAYLITTNLKDYNLTTDEKQALKDFENLEWQEFKIQDLFSVKSYKKRFDANKVTLINNGGFPYIVRTALNNGLKGFIDEDDIYLNSGNTISFGQDTATIFYQENPYFTGDKIKILEAKFNKFYKNNAQFFITSMNKSFLKFSWGSSSFSEKIINNQSISLPIKNKNLQNDINNIDFNFIENFIKAIEKLVIKDVVDFADEKISLTKKCIKTPCETK